jgi:hypothetical protein
MIGNIIIGVTAETDFESKIALPSKRPNEAPQKVIKKNTKQ